MPDYENGCPNWVDVGTTDLDKAVDFYSGVFGWEAGRGGPEVGGYTIFTLNGEMTAGAGPIEAGQHSHWTTYIKTDDTDATAEAVKANGGTILMGPMDVMDQGRMLLFNDPTGAVCGTWQPGEHKGAEYVNQPNGWSWSELYSREFQRDIDFYKAVFGYNTDKMDMGPTGEYIILKTGDRGVAGAIDMSKMDLPDHIPAHWLPYFNVTNLDESLGKIESAGGKSMTPKMDTPMGPFAVVADNTDAIFAIIQINPQS